MDQEIQIFKNNEFGEIRTAGTADNPKFCLTDVCNALELIPSKVAQRLQDDVLSKYPISDSLGRQQLANFVNEDGLYDVILDSRKPEARKFRKWITSEVLPSIRETGKYSLAERTNNQYNVPKSFAEALRLAADQQEQIEKQQKLIEEQKPKAEFFDSVAGSKTAIEMKEVANVLNFNKVGRNKLFQILRDNHLLTYKNQPYQKYIDCGYFRTIEQEWRSPDGDINISIKTLVYQTGVDYIRKLLIKLGYKPHKKENNEFQDNDIK